MTRVLVVAGHDSSGGAGTDADRDAARAFEAEAVCVVTARTVQDEGGVREVRALAPEEWLAEASAALAAAPAAFGALKLGLLPGAPHLRAAAALIDEARAAHPDLPVVLDPVIASSSGFTFLDEAAVEALRAELLSRAVVVTPNLAEAALLAGLPEADLVATPDARLEAARRLLARGAAAAVVTGGHGREDPILDLVLSIRPETGTERTTWLEHPRAPGPGIRGSGCRFATALACALARGNPLEPAAQVAATFVAARIRSRSAPT